MQAIEIIRSYTYLHSTFTHDVVNPSSFWAGLLENWLKVERSINFCRIKMFFTAYVLCSLRLLKLKSEGQAINKTSL